MHRQCDIFQVSPHFQRQRRLRQQFAGKVKVKKGGGYYLDDGPMDEVPDNLLEVPDAEPRVEKLASGPNKPYVVFGRTYTPMTRISAYRKKGVGSWYGMTCSR